MQGHSISIHGHHVEAKVGVWSNDLHEIGREPAKRLPFGRIYGGKRAAEAAVGTEFDLYENDRIAVPAHQIDLAAGQAQIPADDTVAGLRKKRRCPVFTGAALGAVTLPAQHRTRRQAGPHARATSRSDDAARVHIL